MTTLTEKKIKETAHAIVEEIGTDLAAGLVEYANLVKELAEDLSAEELKDTTKLEELLSGNLPNWDAEDWEDLRAAVVQEQERSLKEWQQKTATVTMTNEEWSLLSTYLLMSTNHRKGEAEAWAKLATEKDENGEPTFKNAASNAEFWQEIITGMEKAIKTIDSRNWN